MPGQQSRLLAVNGPLLEDFKKVIRALLHHSVGFSRRYLVWTSLVLHVREHIAAKDGPDAAQAQRHVDFEAAAFFGRLVELILREKKEAKILQAHSVQSHFVGFVILPEPARAAGSGRQKDVVVQRLLLAVRSDLGF